MNKLFWKNKSVLITGHEGFLGSNLTRKLLAYDANVVGLDIKVNRKNTIFTAANDPGMPGDTTSAVLARGSMPRASVDPKDRTLTKDDYKKIKVIKGSVANFNLVKNIISKHKIEIIFHLAAEALVGESHKNPLRAFSSNIEGTWNILEACRQIGSVRGIIIASSDKAYGSHKKLPYKEDAPLIGDHPYDVSKSCADLIAYTYWHTYGVPVGVTRCGNIFGPGDFNFSRIIPDAIRCAILNKTLIVRSDGKFTRDYVYVDDIVNGYIMLAEQLQKKKLFGEAFNFSDENPMTVLDVLKEINKLTKGKLKYKILNQAKYEIKHQYLDSRKARKILGWKPKCLLVEGIRKAIEWYGDYLG